MTLKEFFIKLGLDADTQAFVKAELLVNALKETLRASVDIAKRFGEEIVKTAEEAAHLERLAQVTKMSTASLQELEYAAESSGLDLKEMQDHLSQLSERAQQAAQGSGEASAAFQSLGINVKDSKGKLKDLDVIFTELAVKISSMEDGTEKTANIVQIFGDSGAMLVPLLNQGADGIERLREEARALGVVMDDAAVIQGAEAARSMKQFEAAMTGLRREISGAFLADLRDLAQGFLEWWKINRKLIAQRLDKVFSVIRIALKGLVAVFSVLAKVAGIVIDNIEFLAYFFSSVLLAAITLIINSLALAGGGFIATGVAAVAAGLRAAAAWTLANLPMIALTALFALILLFAEDLYTWIEGGDSLMGKLWDKYKGFIRDWERPKEEDSWLLKILKLTVQGIDIMINDWDTAVANMKLVFGMFIDWIIEKIVNIGKAIKAAVKDGLSYVAGYVDKPNAIAQAYREKAEVSLQGPAPQGNGQWLREIGAGDFLQRFGLGAAPSAPVQRILAPQFKADFKIEVQPGMDEEAIGNKTAEKMDDWFHSKMREADAGVGG